MLKFSSKNQKIVIVADPHNDYKTLDTIFKKEDGAINICLGDWFDSFVYDFQSSYKDTAKYLKDEFLTKPNNYTLFGNHDLHYLFDSPVTLCSGYEKWKYKIIDEVLGKDRETVRDKFHWFIVVDDILLTHAGFDQRLLPPFCNTNESIFKYLDQSVNDANTNLKINERHWFYEAGRFRGGRAQSGGIVWCDFNNEFQPIEELRQIVGHTNQYKTHRAAQHHLEGVANIVDAHNICIDCGLRQYITILNGKLEIKNYVDL